MAMITCANIALYCQEIDLEAMKILNLCYERAKEVYICYIVQFQWRIKKLDDDSWLDSMSQPCFTWM